MQQAKRIIVLVLAMALVLAAPLWSAWAAPVSGLDDDAIISYWNLDEPIDPREDSVSSYDLSSGNVLARAPGKIGWAAEFGDSPFNYFVHDDNDDLSINGHESYTAVAWVNFASAGTTLFGRMILSKWNYTENEREFFLGRERTSGNIRWCVSPNGVSATCVDSSGSVSLNNWHFVVAWHDADDDEICVQVDNGTPACQAHTGGVRNGTSEFRLGILSKGLSAESYMDGLIDEVGVWKRVLTNSERTALWNSGDGCTYPFNPCIPASPTPSMTPSQLRVSVNYIDAGSFELSTWTNSAWDTVINDPAIRMMSGAASNMPVGGGQDAALWQDLAMLGAPTACGSNAAIILDNSPPEDLRTGRLSQNFDWPGGSMYISFLGKTTPQTKGDVSLLNLGTGMLIPVDPHFGNSTSSWVTARYVYNLAPGRYRLSFSARGTAGQFGFFAIDDVNVRQGWWVNDCDAPAAPGLVPAQQAPQFPTVPPYTPVAPTQWIVWSSPTPLSPGATATPIVYTTHARTPIPPPPDYPPGQQILRNGSFETWIGPPFWLPNSFAYWQSVSRLTRRIWTGGIGGRAYASLDTGAKPPALSQHFEQRVGPQPVHVSLWANNDSHLVVFIRDAPMGIYRAAWRIDSPLTGGWQLYEFTSPPLPAGRYSIELTNVYLQQAHIDEVCVAVVEQCSYPDYYPGVAPNATAQAEATMYVDSIVTMEWSDLSTGNANLTQWANQQQTLAALSTSSYQTQQAGATLSAAQQATGTAMAYGATQTQQALSNSQAQTATAMWRELEMAQTQFAMTQIRATQTAVAAQQTQSANQTQIVQTAQAQFAALQTALYLTANAPAALTATAASIIATAQAPFYATQTAIAYLQTQAAATAQGTPPEPTATADVILLTQQALIVPEQPEPYWAAICQRPPNALNLAWWIDYEVCRILSWFAWSPVNTAHVETWQVQVTAYEPFGLLAEVLSSIDVTRAILNSVDWDVAGSCEGEVVLGDIFIPATGVLQGNFSFNTPGVSIDLNCLLPLRPFLGDGIADGVCGMINILCRRGLLLWIQFVFDINLFMLFMWYIQQAWIAKATQG